MDDSRRIRIGNQTASSASSIVDPFDYAVRNGFDAFEWFPDKKENGSGWEEADVVQEMRMWIKATAGQRDIALSVHAPWNINPLVPGANDRLAATASFAEEIDARLINIHLFAEKGVEEYVHAIAPLIERAGKRGLKLSIENTPETTPEHFNALFKRLRLLLKADGKQVGMCLDIGHANLCPATRNDYLRFLDLLEPWVPITHIHLHENYGDFDSHLTLFTGPAARNPAGLRGLIDRVRQREFSGCMILEQWPQQVHLLNDARIRLREFLSQEPHAPANPSMPDGLDFITVIVNANRQYQSWRKRLEWICGLLVGRDEITQEQLVYLAIYLRFIGTGEIQCAEDGGHYRPSHHAKASGEIHKSLVRITTPENTFIVRKIYPWLPSFSSEFTRAEPLTRIRNIAHRNDIPPELKRELKVTLQNKLHRSAGPEDLATSEALLRRITASGAGYSSAFVEEFKRFHEELKEFFNATSLDEDLAAIVKEADDQLGILIRRFVELKPTADTLDQQIRLLDILTQLRSELQRVSEGKADASGLEARQIDIKLEGFAFALLSRITNHFSAVDEFAWLSAVRALCLAVANIRLTGISPAECSAIEAELRMTSQQWKPADRDWPLLLYSTVARCSRLTEFYSGKILALFPERVEALGRALGVDERARKNFAEADIRGNLVFQLSRLGAVLRAKIRPFAGLPPWEVIVPGKVVGYLSTAENLTDLPADLTRPCVVLPDEVEGDEKIPSSVVGIIAGHDVPHLSHLAIRARQRGVVFVVCEEEQKCRELRERAGEYLLLDASAETVIVRKSPVARSSPEVSAVQKVRRERISIPDALLSPREEVLDIRAVTPERGGAKAAGARILEELAGSPGSDFRTPDSAVIPFGIMEQSLHALPDIETDYSALVDRLDALAQAEFIKTLDRLRGCILQLPVAPWIHASLDKKFGRDIPLIVRSSTNAEDLENFAGAGLYASYANVSLNDVAQVLRQVWSSLWTPRATMSRMEAGIPHSRVHMAVLIQQMIGADLSFIMHTTNPVNHDPDEVYIELAVGLGEVLASGGIPGAPYRMLYNRKGDSIEMLAHAGFSEAVLPDAAGGTTRKVVDYSAVKFSTDQTYRRGISKRLGRIGNYLALTMAHAQDVEGAIVGDTIYLVQSRAQLGKL